MHAAEDWCTTRSEQDDGCVDELGELTACGMNYGWDALIKGVNCIYTGAAAQRHTLLVGLGVAHSHYTVTSSRFLS